MSLKKNLKMEGVLPSERCYQVGNIIKIRKEPRRAKLFGFTMGTEHVIQNPPKEYKGHGTSINCHAGVWVNDVSNRLRFLSWEYYFWTGRCNKPTEKSKIKRIRRNVI
jgi:hypothetical protein